VSVEIETENGPTRVSQHRSQADFDDSWHVSASFGSDPMASPQPPRGTEAGKPESDLKGMGTAAAANRTGARPCKEKA
jgi:hypothetical protein